jgi:hypothetical protein
MPLIRMCAAVPVLLTASAAMAQQPPEGRLMRFPDVQGDRIVFDYGGDLWLAPAHGGAASLPTSKSTTGPTTWSAAKMRSSNARSRK